MLQLSKTVEQLFQIGYGLGQIVDGLFRVVTAGFWQPHLGLFTARRLSQFRHRKDKPC